jgi:pentatricopeptide repeat protein
MPSAYTAIIDTLLKCASVKDALCLLEETMQQAGWNPKRKSIFLKKHILHGKSMRADNNFGNTFLKETTPVRCLISEVEITRPR